MQVPTLQQTQDHLRGLNFRLEKVREEDSRIDRYQLRDPQGDVRGRYDTLVEFWAVWLGYASEVISEGRRVERFIDEFTSASVKHRRDMIGWHEGRLSNQDPEPFKRWMAKYPDFSPDCLPQDWERQLKDNLNGWIAGRPATRCMIEKLAEIDTEARDRFRRLPAEIGLPGFRLVD